jgi:hypothetical protein
MSNEPMTPTNWYHHSVVDRLRTEQDTVVLWAAVAAAASVLVHTLLTIAGNLPFEPITGIAPLRSILSVITPVSLAVAASAIAVAIDISSIRVGLLFIAAFVITGSVSPAAGLPAILGIITGGAVALSGRVTRETTSEPYRRIPLVGSAILGIAVSLGGTVGLTPSGIHEVGVAATLLAVALLAVVLPVDWLSVAGGFIAALGLLAAGIWAPFATGATLLVGFSITNIPVLAVAIAVFGGVTALASSVRNRAVLPVAGCVLCLFSGIPTTIASAAGLVLGLTLVLCRDALTHPRGEFA